MNCHKKYQKTIKSLMKFTRMLNKNISLKLALAVISTYSPKTTLNSLMILSVQIAHNDRGFITDATHINLLKKTLIYRSQFHTCESGVNHFNSNCHQWPAVQADISS